MNLPTVRARVERILELEAAATKPSASPSRADEGDNPRVIFYEEDRAGVDFATFRGGNRFANADHYAAMRSESPRLLRVLLAALEEVEARRDHARDLRDPKRVSGDVVAAARTRLDAALAGWQQ